MFRPLEGGPDGFRDFSQDFFFVFSSCVSVCYRWTDNQSIGVKRQTATYLDKRTKSEIEIRSADFCFFVLPVGLNLSVESIFDLIL